MHKTAIIAVSALCMLASARVASAQTGYAEAEIGESTINIECVFNQPDFKEKLYDAGISSPDFICDFFVLDNALYFSMRVMTRPDEQKISADTPAKPTGRYLEILGSRYRLNGQTPPALGNQMRDCRDRQRGSSIFRSTTGRLRQPAENISAEFSASIGKSYCYDMLYCQQQ